MKNITERKDYLKREIASYERSISNLNEELEELGYSVFIRNSGGKKVIMWSTKTHWASASFLDSTEDDLKRVCQRLKETIYNVKCTLTSV